MTRHPVLTLRVMRDRRAEDVITGGLATSIARSTGALTPTGQSIKTNSPCTIVFASV